MVTWDPAQYRRFGSERDRPFVDLLGQIGATSPRRVVDLGCGTGHLTALLRERWPDATVEGIDSSAEMIADAASVAGVSFRVASIESWRAEPDTDVVISNAALQWVPTHRALVRSWADALPSGAWLAWQVPGNFDQPSHALMRALAGSPRWSSRLSEVLRHEDPVDSPAGYASLLLDAGFGVSAWETTYLHLLPGADPVLDWVRGTGLRPILDTLSSDEGDGFCAEFAARLREAYPSGPHGTLFPFRRIFCVGRKP